MEHCKDIKMDGCMEGYMNGWVDDEYEWKGGRMERWVDERTNKHRVGWNNAFVDGSMDKWMHRRMDGRIDGRMMHQRMDRRME